MFVLVNSGDPETQTREDIRIENIIADIVIRAKPGPLAVSATSKITEWAAHGLIGGETHGPPAVSTLDKARRKFVWSGPSWSGGVLQSALVPGQKHLLK